MKRMLLQCGPLFEPRLLLRRAHWTSHRGKLPRTYHVWPHGKYETDEAKLPAFRPDSGQGKMPGWMFTHMSMNFTATLDEAMATYLETVAWETWQDVSKRLAAAGGVR